MSNESEPIVITRNLVKRGWTDFEPKIITGLLTGGVAAWLVTFLSQYGVHLSSLGQNILVVGCYFLGAYLTPSSGQTITRTVQNDITDVVKEVESHTGAAISTITSPTKIITSPAPGVFTQTISDPNAATQKIPDPEPTPAAKFLSTLPSSNDGGH